MVYAEPGGVIECYFAPINTYYSLGQYAHDVEQVRYSRIRLRSIRSDREACWGVPSVQGFILSSN